MNNKYQPGNVCLFSLVLLGSLFLNACQQESESQATAQSAAESEAVSAGSSSVVVEAPAKTQTIEHSLFPLPGQEETAPAITRKTTLLMQTTTGELLIEIYPEAAPNAAARFIELVENGYYNNTPISRVVPGFVAQFGINWRDGYKEWQDRNFDDDTSYFELARGTLAFAKSGANSNSTQVFINYGQNNYLAAPQYNFTVFGKVVKGMEFVDQFIQVGDPSGGLDQGRLWDDGEAYLGEQAVMPSFIEKISIIE